jgi:large subunit ribosomal protein L30
MIAIIRIHGQAEVKKDIEETLKRLCIYRKYTASIIDENKPAEMEMAKKVENYIMYGKIDEKMMKELIAKRGQTLNGKKISEKDAEKTAEEIKKGHWKIKKFFRLHPPIGGFKKSTKLQYPKGILGRHEDISKLLVRML